MDRLVLLKIKQTMSSQSNSENNSFIADVLSIDSIIKASYEVVSGEKEPKDNGKETSFCIILKQFILSQIDLAKNRNKSLCQLENFSMKQTKWS